MDLARKLARLGTAGPMRRDSASPGRTVATRAATGGADDGRVDRLRTMLNEMIARQKSEPITARSPGVAESLPGEVIQTSSGPLHVIDNFLEPAHCHGDVPIAGALSVDPDTVSKLALDPRLAGLDPKRMLFLDTETTGLMGGAGTLAFLVGLGWFEDESFRVEQLFLPKPGGEAPILERVAERIARASCLVTYNGKSYDWPLLKSRFVLNRLPIPVLPLHLDLLHAARRVYKPRMGHVRLVAVEREVLGMFREADVDGCEIPALYWSFVRGAEASTLALVIEHNANDIVALAAILSRLHDGFHRVLVDDHPLDHLGRAKVAERASDPLRALAFASAAAEGGGDAQMTVDALVLAAKLHRRAGDHHAAEEALLRALDRIEVEGDTMAKVHLALSKLYEHKLKDLEKARIHAVHTASAEGAQSRDHRLERLERRIERRRSSSLTREVS